MSPAAIKGQILEERRDEQSPERDGGGGCAAQLLRV